MNAQRDAPLPKSERQVVKEIVESEKWRCRSVNEKQTTKANLGLGATETLQDAAKSSMTMISKFEALQRQVKERKRKLASTIASDQKAQET